KCVPSDRIIFLKTHKTGSSTITNILNRFGDKNNLLFALPKYGYSLRWPAKFQVSHMAPLPIQPHILANHARNNPLTLYEVFPKTSWKYITILRNPVMQYESLFHFFKFSQLLKVNGHPKEALSMFLQSPRSYKPSNHHTITHLVRNPMLFDLGFEKEYFDNTTALHAYIDFLNREFDLVLIMDYWDESMVLLKRRLCWELDDVIYLKLNSRVNEDKRGNMSESTKQNILRWNHGDAMLFEFFNKLFWANVRAEGPEFYNDLEELQKKKKDVLNRCV
ncbi:predicted protein, partial [Nematostella vectensis]